MDQTHAFLDTQLHYIAYRVGVLVSEGRADDAAAWLDLRLGALDTQCDRDGRLYVAFREGSLRRLLPDGHLAPAAMAAPAGEDGAASAVA